MKRLVLLIGATIVAGACGKSGKEEGAPPAVVGARTGTAVVKPFARVLTAIGVVEARPGTNSALGAPGPTRVAQVFVTVGQRVEQGTPLVEFERGPFEAVARQAEAALVGAQRNRDRVARLSEAGVVPRKDLDQAETELAQAEAASVTARRSLQLATLRAPASGVVTRMIAVIGAPVDANQPVVEIADPRALDVVFNLSSSEAASVHQGQAISITAGEAGQGEKLGEGRVIGVALAIDTASRSVAVRANLANPSRGLRIGETVFGRIAVSTNEKAVVIPAEALVPEGEGFKVFVVDSSGTAHATAVDVGSRADGLAEISKGLSGGETIVTYGAYGMEDSARLASPGRARDSAKAK